MLAFRLTGLPDSRLPLYLYCIGTQEQKVQLRPEGFPVHQLFLSRSAVGELKIQGKGSWPVGAGQLWVGEPGVAHEFYPHSRTNGELGYIGIGGGSAGSVLQAAGLLNEGPRDLSDFEQFWLRMADLWHELDDDKSDIWSTSLIVYQLILDIARSVSTTQEKADLTGVVGVPMSPGQREADPGSEAFTRAVALMHAHYQDDLLLKHVAEAVGYSVQHLNRLFHQREGVTGHQYMQRLRLQKASDWLDKHPRASVREAAEMVGMEVNYFIRMFKREFGETPGKGIKQRNQSSSEKGEPDVTPTL
ncbi:AraC family transcriptional regulator [Paenibacillus illinoisensis]|uniref:helix-turn-helix domain-containing protein n=1 Tax=Paenibacillus illinoisensis TaxID=59845 RepID=UPI0030196C4A